MYRFFTVSLPVYNPVLDLYQSILDLFNSFHTSKHIYEGNITMQLKFTILFATALCAKISLANFWCNGS